MVFETKSNPNPNVKLLLAFGVSHLTNIYFPQINVLEYNVTIEIEINDIHKRH